MKKLILLALIALIFSSCVTQKRCSKKYPPQVSHRIDSIYIYKEIIKWKDTVIYKDLPPVTVQKFVDVKDTLKLIGNYSKALSWVSAGKILGSLKEGIRPVKIEYKIKEVEVIKEVVRTEYKVEVVTKRFVPLWVKILAGLGVAFVLFIVYKIRY